MKPIQNLLFLWAMLSPAFVFSQTTTYVPNANCSNYNAFVSDGHIEQIRTLVARAQPDGTLFLDPDKPENFATILQTMGVDNGTTFQLVKETKSRLDNTKLYRKYQQYYNGVLVEGGGYTLGYYIPGGPPTDPCAEAYMMAPNVLTNIALSVNPSISAASVPNILRAERIYSSELVIAHNLTNQCEYTLAWKTTYQKGYAQISWVNAHTGAVVKTIDARMNHNAPTETYGPQVLNDLHNGATTTLSTPDGGVLMYNFGNNCPADPLVQAQWTANLIPTTNNPTDWTNEANPRTYQAFWVTSQVVPIYENNGIDFGTVNVANCNTENAFSLRGSTVQNAFIEIGTLGGHSLALFDVIGHELGHTYLNQFLNYTNLGNASLHEGISDILGTYMESFIPGQGLDWVMGDDDPAVANHAALSRNLQTPAFGCVTTAPGEQHSRGLPIGHWFFLVSQGSAADGIPALGLQHTLDILLETLPLINVNADYPQLMTAMMNMVEDQFGRCSNEFLATARAWEEICVPTGFALPSGVIPACNYVLSGPNYVCEESNYLQICLSGGLPGAHYRWTIIGKKSTEFTSLGGMQGNSQEGGTCLTLTHFPTYPYYPQYITIEVYSPTVGSQFIQKKRVKIIDCDGDDPTCDEYYDFQGNDAEERESPAQVELLFSQTDQQPEYVRVFDFVGRLIYEGVAEGFNPKNISYQGLAILVYSKNSGEIVEVKKVLLTNR